MGNVGWGSRVIIVNRTFSATVDGIGALASSSRYEWPGQGGEDHLGSLVSTSPSSSTPDAVHLAMLSIDAAQDVLCGRGMTISGHAGNKNFRCVLLSRVSSSGDAMCLRFRPCRYLVTLVVSLDSRRFDRPRSDPSRSLVNASKEQFCSAKVRKLW